MRHAPIDPALFVAHRRQLRELLPKNGVVVVHAADVLPTSGDGTLRLHPASDLFWLSGIEQEESVLVLAADAAEPAHRELLFIRQPNEQLATWEGEKLSKERAQEISGIANVRWLSELPGVLHALMCESDVVVLNANEHERASAEIEPRDSIFHGIARRGHEDAWRRRPMAEGRAQRESVVVGEPDVEDHGVVRADGREFARHLPGCGGIHRKSRRAQVCRCALPQRIVVFYEQHTHGGNLPMEMNHA
jgi:hypothetical protein